MARRAPAAKDALARGAEIAALRDLFVRYWGASFGQRVTPDMPAQLLAGACPDRVAPHLPRPGSLVERWAGAAHGPPAPAIVLEHRVDTWVVFGLEAIGDGAAGTRPQARVAWIGGGGLAHAAWFEGWQLQPVAGWQLQPVATPEQPAPDQPAPAAGEHRP